MENDKVQTTDLFVILTSKWSFDKPCRDARSKIWLARSGVCVAFPCDLRLCREIKMRQSVANGNLLYLKLMLQAFTQKKWIAIHKGVTLPCILS